MIASRLNGRPPMCVVLQQWEEQLPHPGIKTLTLENFEEPKPGLRAHVAYPRNSKVDLTASPTDSGSG